MAKLIPGENDLQTVFPDVAAEWNAEKNGPLLPTQVAAKTHKKVWWKCKRKGHEWQAMVFNRTCMQSGCPYCRSEVSETDNLQTRFPDIAAEWHPEKNGTLMPGQFHAKSGKKAWWICKRGHEWQAIIGNRTGFYKTGCPYCAGLKAIPGETDLQSQFPDIAKEWHTERNAPLLPSQITYGSGKRVWWKCSKGHEWRAVVERRTGKEKNGCPYCVANSQKG